MDELDEKAETKFKNCYNYWVTYQFKTPTTNGFGGAHIVSVVKANSIRWEEDTRVFLQDKYSLGSVVILGWKRLKGDEEWTNSEESC